MTDVATKSTSTTGPGPSLSWRLLLDGLKKLHDASGLSIDEVARRVRTSRASINRWLTGGKRNLTERDVEDLCEAYGYARDDEVTIRMVGLAQAARQRAVVPSPEWMNYYRFGLFVDLEQAAGEIRTYQVTTLPGLLQTASYAESVVRATGSNLTDEVVAEQVRFRTERQAILIRTPPVELHAIVDESTIHRCVRSAETMRDQLEHLLNLAERPNVTVQVVPYSAGAANAAPAGGFVLFDFDGINGFDDQMGAVAYQETPSEALYREDREQAAKFRRVFDRLAAVALNADESAKMIAATVRADFGGEP